jgi:hypothetical protein
MFRHIHEDLDVFICVRMVCRASSSVPLTGRDSGMGRSFRP